MKIAVFTKNRSNPAYQAARLGADRAAQRFGAQTVHFVPEHGDDPVEQSALVDQALAMRPDAIVFSPVHATRVNAAIERIRAAGIPLFGFVSPIPVGPCVTYVGSDDSRLGHAIAHHLFAHLQGHGRVLVVSGPVASVTSIARVSAFQDAAVTHPGIAIAGTCIGDYVREVARDAVARWLAANEGPDACLAANDVMALGALDALRAARRKAAVAGVNAIPEAIAAIKSGEMLASVDFSAMNMAALATECAVRHLRGEPVPETIELPAEIVDRSNCRRWDLPFEQRPIPTLKEILA
ncbi:MAG TPA: sugar ABC transporter substrate-binding protein [Burkholderiales bacterium]|nr:sugar ABC transporter substrate-binding protein [Burkholderiales bacterium]